MRSGVEGIVPPVRTALVVCSAGALPGSSPEAGDCTGLMTMAQLVPMSTGVHVGHSWVQTLRGQRLHGICFCLRTLARAVTPPPTCTA